MRVLRVYHAGRDARHRARERALAAHGAEVVLVVPSEWPEASADAYIPAEPFEIAEMRVERAGNVNRHAYTDPAEVSRLLREVDPDVLDIHEEPFSVAAHQWLEASRRTLPVTMYAAQNVDKRYPPPFCLYESAALERVNAFYPCSRQAACVVRGKGFRDRISVLPLGYDEALFVPGDQTLDAPEIVMLLAGRLVAEKGLRDAVQALASVHAQRPARLIVAGDGPAAFGVRRLAASLGVEECVDVLPWQSGAMLAARYRRTHVVLLPSHATETWTEQYGRVIVEAQASGAVVVGYATGAIPEVGGEAAVVVEPENVDQFIAGVNRVVSDDEEFRWRRERGIEQAATCTWSAVGSRQLALYEDVRRGGTTRWIVPRSPSLRRAAARAEFGPPAAVVGGVRPFALPVLRRGGVLAQALAGVVDVAAEFRARTPLDTPRPLESQNAA